MENVETTRVHQFGSGLLVEFLGSDEHGEVATETIEFDLTESTAGEVIPREKIPSEYEEYIFTALSERGYSVNE